MPFETTLATAVSAPSWRREKIHSGLVLLAMAAVAVFASLRIGATGFWLDEVSSVVTALDWHRMWDWLLRYEANMWLYYLTLHFWLLLGHSEAMVRGLSVLTAIATLPVIYKLAQRLAGNTAGVLAVFLLATNVFFLGHMQEARAYSMVALLVTASTYFFLRAVEDGSRLHGLAFILCAAGAVYAHFFGGLVLLAQALALGYRPWPHVPRRSLLVGGLVLAALLLPIALFQPLSSGQVDWLSKPAPREIGVLAVRLAGSRPLLVLYAFLCVVAIVPVFRAGPRDARTKRAVGRHLLLLLWLIVPPAIAFTFSVLVKPIWTNRYFIVCVPPLVLLGALGLSRISRSWLRAVLMILLLVLSGRCVKWLYLESPQEDWRALVRFVLANTSQGEPVLFYAYHTRQPFEYYYSALETDSDRLRLCELASDAYRPGGGRGRLPDPNLAFLRSVAEEHDRVWLVLGYCWNKALGRDSQRALVQGALEESHRVVLEHRSGHVVVRRYERVRGRPVNASRSRRSPGVDALRRERGGRKGAGRSGRSVVVGDDGALAAHKVPHAEP